MPTIRRTTYLAGLFLSLLLSQTSSAQTERSHIVHRTEQTPSAAGRSTFNASCSACHGLDGRGSDKAANIATSARVLDLSDTQLASIISRGILGTGMPAFADLTEKQVRGVVIYLRSLQGKGSTVSPPGDATHGREIFFGKGNCSNCHTVAGEGGFLGPDLTSYAVTSSTQVIREEILRSPRVPSPGYRSGVLTTANGDQLEGLIRNEDNFSMQLQTTDGSFHLVTKSEQQHLEYSNFSQMPSNYRDQLNDRELDDLVSFLMTTTDPSKPPRNKKGSDQ